VSLQTSPTHKSRPSWSVQQFVRLLCMTIGSRKSDERGLFSTWRTTTSTFAVESTNSLIEGVRLQPYFYSVLEFRGPSLCGYDLRAVVVVMTL
jgi:hypothetical protein